MSKQRKIRLKTESHVDPDRVFKRILVGVDGSDSSFRAARVAARLAKCNEADSLVVSVIQTPPHPFMPTQTLTSPGMNIDGLQGYYKYATRDAQEWIDKVHIHSSKATLPSSAKLSRDDICLHCL